MRYYGKIHSKLPIFRVKSEKKLHLPEKFTLTASAASATIIWYDPFITLTSSTNKASLHFLNGYIHKIIYDKHIISNILKMPSTRFSWGKYETNLRSLVAEYSTAIRTLRFRWNAQLKKIRWTIWVYCNQIFPLVCRFCHMF